MLKKPYFSNYRVNALKTGSHRSSWSDRLDLSLLSLILQFQQDTNFFFNFYLFFSNHGMLQHHAGLIVLRMEPKRESKGIFRCKCRLVQGNF